MTDIGCDKYLEYVKNKYNYNDKLKLLCNGLGYILKTPSKMDKKSLMMWYNYHSSMLNDHTLHLICVIDGVKPMALIDNDFYIPEVIDNDDFKVRYLFSNVIMDVL